MSASCCGTNMGRRRGISLRGKARSPRLIEPNFWTHFIVSERNKCYNHLSRKMKEVRKVEKVTYAEILEHLASMNGKYAYFVDEVFRTLDKESAEYEKLHEIACNLGLIPR